MEKIGVSGKVLCRGDSKGFQVVAGWKRIYSMRWYG